MLGELFHTFIFIPFYNALIGLISVIPTGDVGVAVVVLTILVKFILFPLSMKAVKTQMVMREIEAPLKEIKEKYKDDKQEQALRTMALYKEKGINPLSSIFVLFLQLPIIFGLYWVFYKGGLPQINTNLLYSFLSVPDHVSMEFLGLIHMGEKSALLALLAGVSQFFQAKFSLPALAPRQENSTFKDDLARSMHIQMRYILPVTVTFIAYYISAAVALYWFTSNMVAIGQELYFRRVRAKEPHERRTT
jgi:YidC/Oxa1 family membrane protein insertase